MTVLSAGARPVATARSSIAGLRPSMTASTSFGGEGGTPLPEDPQTRVLLALAATTAGEQPDEEDDRDDADRRDDDRERREHDRHRLGVDRQRGRRLGVEARPCSQEQ